MGVKVLFVCLGNICRSPTAARMLRHLAQQAGVLEPLEIDSAGTGDWHVGRPPGPRAQRAAIQRGFDIAALRSRQISAQDLCRFDYIIAMHHANRQTLAHRAGDRYQHKIHLFLDFAETVDLQAMPDPYYGDDRDSGYVIELIEQAGNGLLLHIQNTR